VRRRGVPLSTWAELLPAARRARVQRLAVVGLVLALLATAVALAFGRTAVIRSYLPPDRTTILVLDVSSSIDSTTYRQIQHTLAQLAGSHDRVGLVLFSDIAYEALPPGTPARELKPLLRYFTPLKDKKPIPGYPSFTLAEQPFPVNPWADTFTGGTRISSGLVLARQVIADNHIARPLVLLVSDLATDYRDIPLTESLLRGYVRDRIPLQVVGLSPLPGDRSVFEHALGAGGGSVGDAAPVAPDEAPRVQTLADGFPKGLVVAALLLLLALAAYERLSVRIDPPREVER
jgi:hypothetical protein